MPRPFHLIDVFGLDDFSGNPLAVVAEADGLDADAMLRIADWLNLSETTFLLRPTDPAADYRVRIFTTSRELPFAGHPTLGSGHAWLAGGGTPRRDGVVVQECGAGLVTLRATADGLAFAAPPLLRSGAPAEADVVAAAAFLGIDRAAVVDAAWLDNGPGWLGLMLASADAVLAVEPARASETKVDLGIVGPHAPGGEVAYELRAFFSDARGAVVEDPVTGSLNASVALWLYGSGRASGPYTAAQGTRLGRAGRIRVSRDEGGTVWVGGRTRTLFSGLSGA